MSQCYRCNGYDVPYPNKRERKIGVTDSQTLVWVCTNCRDNELPIIREKVRPSMAWLWPLLGWATLVSLLYYWLLH